MRAQLTVIHCIVFKKILTDLCQLSSVSFLLCILFPGFQGFTCTSAEKFSFFQSVWSCYKTVRALEWIWNLDLKPIAVENLTFFPLYLYFIWARFPSRRQLRSFRSDRDGRVLAEAAVNHKCTLAPLTLFYCKMWWGDGNHTRTQSTVNLSRHCFITCISARVSAEVRWWKHWPLSLWTGSYKIPETFTRSADGSCCCIRFANLPDQMSCSVAGAYPQPDENSFMVNCSIHFLNVITNCFHRASHQFLIAQFRNFKSLGCHLD